MGRMPAAITFSHGQRGKRADLSELLPAATACRNLYAVTACMSIIENYDCEICQKQGNPKKKIIEKICQKTTEVI